METEVVEESSSINEIDSHADSADSYEGDQSEFYQYERKFNFAKAAADRNGGCEFYFERNPCTGKSKFGWRCTSYTS